MKQIGIQIVDGNASNVLFLYLPYTAFASIKKSKLYNEVICQRLHSVGKQSIITTRDVKFIAIYCAMKYLV